MFFVFPNTLFGYPPGKAVKTTFEIWLSHLYLINIKSLPPLTYSQLIIDKDAKTIQQRKNSFFKKLMALKKLHIHVQKNEIGPLSHTIHKN